MAGPRFRANGLRPHWTGRPSSESGKIETRFVARGPGKARRASRNSPRRAN